jgi:hypothetical protein
MSFLNDELRAELGKAEPGLELVRYWSLAAKQSTEHARALLSYFAASLLSRGWVHPVDKMIDTAADQIGIAHDVVKAVFEELVKSDLVSVDGQRITALAGLISTRPTGLVFYLDHERQLNLLGPLAALAVSKALRQKGEVRATDAIDGARKLKLGCDTAGIATREPDSIGMFLPSWSGDVLPSQAMGHGAFFADDDALGKWQEQKGDPAGMPLTSFMFQMVAPELGHELGAALDPVLNHRPNFD